MQAHDEYCKWILLPASTELINYSAAIGSITSFMAQQTTAKIGAKLPTAAEKAETNKLMSDMNNMLNEEGICYISTMEDEHNKSGYETSSKGNQVYLHYYEGEYLINELEQKGFEIVELFRKSSVMTNGKEVADLAIISRKKKGL